MVTISHGGAAQFASDLALAFADQCRRWALELGASEPAAHTAHEAARRLIEQLEAGHVCLPLLDTDLNLEALAASGVAAPPGSGTPMVLDGHERLYLARHFEAERSLAHALITRHRRMPPPPGEAARVLLNQLFPAGRQGEPDWQQIAVALALCRRLVCISGGPGTGKTTTVARLLACFQAELPGCRIGLAAPTGKAAARLHEALLSQSARLPAGVLQLGRIQAGTVHRLLGLGPEGSRPFYGRDNPLPLDVLVVDEASMLDLTLALQILEALAPDARLILLGDKAQLQAVEVGAVFSALAAHAGFCAATARQLETLTGWPAHQLQQDCGLGRTRALGSEPGSNSSPPLQDAVIWLTRSYRFTAESDLGQFAEALVAGELERVQGCFTPDGVLRQYEPQESSGFDERELALFHAAYQPYLEALQAWHQGQADLAQLFAAFSRFRVLAVTRQGSRSVQAINQLLSARLLKSFSGRGLSSGQPVMVLRNDRASNLFNGDVGIALRREAGLAVYFPAASTDGTEAQEGYRALLPASLPPYEPAFALTVHKAQGSEFDGVAVVLPEQESPLLTRELIYTAVTRAKKSACILGHHAVLQRAMTRLATREDGLAVRLAACAQQMADAPE